MMRERCIRPLICPVCHSPLAAHELALRCEQGHSFDRAREGYVNLLLSRKKLPDTVGDAAFMLQARRRFLDSGAYAALHTAVNQLAYASLTNQPECVSVLDAGCGEGYYISQLGQFLAHRMPETAVCTFGTDIAKTAVKLAARRDPATQFLVADTNQFIPCADESLHLLLNVFAPRHPVEFARVLAVGGHLLIVIPGPEHLAQLRAQFGLLDIEPEKQPKLVTQLADYFTLQQEQSVVFSLQLDKQQFNDLVQMTPSARHLSLAQQQAMQEIPSFTTVAQFQLLLFRKL
ncbi:MAG: methyltransferase domain-containing protein [Chloroflexota bacterium]